MTQVIRILLVDDHSFVRGLMSNLLSAEIGIEIVGEAPNGEEALALVPITKPDIVLMDVHMPGMNGLETMAALQAIQPDIKVLMVSASLDKSLASQCLNAGARGFFSKVNDHNDMLKAIRRVYSGYLFISANVIADTVYLKKGFLNPLDLLTERELQVVLLLTQGMPIKKIAEHLQAGVRTIKTHRMRALLKLGLENDIELTHLAYRYGLLKKAASPSPSG